jgi:hypothetical protein
LGTSQPLFIFFLIKSNMSVSESLIDALIGSELELDSTTSYVSDNDDISMISGLVSVTNNRDKISAAILTIFPPDTDLKYLKPESFFDDLTGLKVWCGQFENGGKTGILHAHIYMEWQTTCRKRFAAVCDAIVKATDKPGDVRRTKRLNTHQRSCAVNYVLKPTDRVQVEKPQYIWPFNNPVVKFRPDLWEKKPSKISKEDLDEKRRSHIESRPKWWTWDQIVHENDESKKLLCTCSWGKTYHAGRYAEASRRDISEVIIMYGAGGTGKTTLARALKEVPGEVLQERYYRRNPDDGVFWGGGRTAYKGQRVVHFEEFCGQEPFARIKEVCDIGKAGPPVNIKNGGVELNHECVVFTSNYHPAAWYNRLWSDDHKQFHPFWRRVTKVMFFPAHREDGSLNTPDEQHPPFFIDQTDQWKKLEGDFTECLKHAEEFWPLKESGGTGASPFFNQPDTNHTSLLHRYCMTGRHPDKN